jgi:hypothetical protein
MLLQEKELLEAAEQQPSLRLTFLLRLTESNEVSWETVLWQHRLYIQVPSYLLPEGSKEGWVCLQKQKLCMSEVNHCPIPRKLMYLKFIEITSILGHALIQAVSFRPLTADTWGLHPGHSMHSLWWTTWHCDRFSVQVFWFSYVGNILLGLHCHLSSVGWTVGPLLATVQKHSFTLPTWTVTIISVITSYCK